MRMQLPLLLIAGLAACAADAPRDDGSGGGGGPCREGERRCAREGDGVFEACTAEGTWERAGACEGECQDGGCATTSCPDESARECTEDGLLRLCDAAVGGWLDPRPCPTGEVCFDGRCRPQVCVPGRRYCGDETTVLACDPIGARSQVLETCDETFFCTNGTCVSECAAAEARHSSVGCDFYALDTDNLTGMFGSPADDCYQYTIIVANASLDGHTATVRVETRQADGTWAPIAPAGAIAEVPPGQTKAFPATCCATGIGSYCDPANLAPDQHPEGTGKFPRMAFRVRSNYPIVAYQLNSDDIQFAASSTGASILLPRGAIDREYYALTLPHSNTGGSWVAIVGTEDDTTVTLRSSAATAAGGEVPELAAGQTYIDTIDDGEVLQIRTGERGQDLSGTYVTADRDIAVFAGHEDAQPSPGGLFADTSDHIEEQMLPVVAWGKTYVAATAPLCAEAGCAGGCGYAQTPWLWRILAARDDTEVTFESDGTLRGVPPQAQSLDAAEFIQFAVTGNCNPTSGVCTNRGEYAISADQPILVANYSLSGPTAMVLMAPVEQYLPTYVYATTTWFNDVLTIIRPEGTSVLIDGAAPGGAWTAAGAGHEVLHEGICVDNIAHTVTSAGGLKTGGFGTIVSGNGGSCTYAYLGGINTERLNIPE